MRYFRHLMEAFLNPLFLILVIFAVLLYLLYKEHNTRLFSSFLLFFFLMVALGMGFIPQTITRTMENGYSVIHKPDPNIHWVVVLSGGQAEGNDKPANMMLYGSSIKRLAEGIRLYRHLPAAKLVLSGGGIKEEIPEAKRLAKVAEWFNMPKEDIILEDIALNTAAEAKEIKKIVGTKPFYLVTSAIHMKRAMWWCQHQGLNPIAAPTDFTLFWQDERWEKRFIPNAHNLVYLSVAFHEILGIGWSKLSGLDAAR